ncbi:Necrosis inducing protein (NPP1) [Streptosporangium subroseum]|uniref:Necrosis inducing protein (NPP1) n=2 Tax=Streptosporangium subroseum TaxID=106412 RepID=A0A239I286_9ACTN|nr:Necrosis inducing protein (NPP1) [Streptosporangium subroseum]
MRQVLSGESPVGAPPVKSRSRRRFGKLSFALRAFTAAVAMLVVFPGIAFADPPAALDWAAPWPDRIYEPGFDYDGDGCYPTPAIGRDGTIAPGLSLGGAENGHCRDSWDLDNTNAYSRVKCNNGWCAYMYALYFEKDQAALGPGSAGHRNDWEHVVVWVQGEWGMYVSTSAHGNYTTRQRNDVPWDETGKHPFVVYHKDGASTHCFRHANFGEKPENHKGQWQWPTLIGWDNYPPGFRDRLVNYDFGSAHFGIKDGSFEGELAKAKPAGIPFDPYA